MSAEQNHSVKGDRALAHGGDDKLGFRDVAARIATSVADRATEDGFVIGIEGAWGSGKSSLLFLIGDELEKLPSESRPNLIRFQPWLIGNRDALITSVFDELSRQLDQVALGDGDATRDSVTKAKAAKEALQNFLTRLGQAGELIELAGEAPGFGWLKWIGKGAKAAGEAAKKGEAPSLVELKDKLIVALRDLGQRFVITIDDVDRLEPSEVIEILRLVRSVVDLPNVIYLLCYDIDILSHSIKKATRVKAVAATLKRLSNLPSWFQSRNHSNFGSGFRTNSICSSPRRTRMN
ncbi:KAP family P-loop NTPase fold protein [Rhizorhabdus dicambivorans]|nr:P-loop NTPase fold protein [Rhizorhabdus dicambivorans]